MVFPTKPSDPAFVKSLIQTDFTELGALSAKQPIDKKHDDYISIEFALQLRTQLWIEGLERTVIKELGKVLNMFCKRQKARRPPENDISRIPQRLRTRNKYLAEKRVGF